MNTPGLSTQRAEELLQKCGRNVLTGQHKQHWWSIFFRQLKDTLVLILLAAVVVSYVLGETHDALVILGIIILNAVIGFIQEWRTEQTLAALKNMVHPTIRAFRNNEQVLLNTELLVPEDIVLLSEGDKIPADGVVIESNSLSLEESALTGESMPVRKNKDDMVFMGTSITKGTGIMRISATGMQTRFGEITALTTKTNNTLSPLQKELQGIGLFVAKVTGVLCILLFGFGLLRGSSLIESLLFSVSVAIAAVPEGLPTTVTIALAIGAGVLARKKAVMKRLSGVETLGAVSTICSDKTGTLTRNEMTVRQVWTSDNQQYLVSGVGYDPRQGSVHMVYKNRQGSSGIIDKLYTICMQCNEASLVQKNNHWSPLGDPTEIALLTLTQKDTNGFSVIKEPQQRIALFPFDSDRKMMSVVTQTDKEKKVLTKGSPDHILARCTQVMTESGVVQLDNQKRAEIQKKYQQMASSALRVLAFAERVVIDSEEVSTEEEAEQNLVFVGLVGMMDPPRDEVSKAIKDCHKAGIRVIIITGDYGETARAVASELGLIYNKNEWVVTGAELEQIDDNALQEKLLDRSLAIIVARAMPHQKRRIVELLQNIGEVVAMTGDGVNDAPALKKADIGVAMGVTGTEVSKEAATMVLQNDSFATIVMAVREGRRIYENLKKAVWFIFGCNIGELTTIFLSLLFQFPLPLTAILILVVDLGTDILPAVALGTDTAENELMNTPPRDPKQHMLTKSFIIDFALSGLLIGVLVSIAYVWTLIGDGWRPEDGVHIYASHASTVAFTALVMVQLVNVFSARSWTQSVFTHRLWDNSFLLLSVLSSVLLLLLTLYVPFINTVLGTMPLNIQDWGVVCLVSILPLLYLECRKYIRRRDTKMV